MGEIAKAGDMLIDFGDLGQQWIEQSNAINLAKPQTLLHKQSTLGSEFWDRDPNMDKPRNTNSTVGATEPWTPDDTNGQIRQVKSGRQAVFGEDAGDLLASAAKPAKNNFLSRLMSGGR